MYMFKKYFCWIEKFYLFFFPIMTCSIFKLSSYSHSSQYFHLVSFQIIVGLTPKRNAVYWWNCQPVTACRVYCALSPRFFFSGITLEPLPISTWNLEYLSGHQFCVVWWKIRLEQGVFEILIILWRYLTRLRSEKLNVRKLFKNTFSKKIAEKCQWEVSSTFLQEGRFWIFEILSFGPQNCKNVTFVEK